MREDIAAGDFALLIVTPTGAENVPHAALGDRWIGRGRRDLKDAVLLINFRSGDGDAGIVMTDDELDAVGSKIVGHRNTLLRVGDVITELDAQLLAENAAGRIDVGGSLFDAIFHLCAGRGVGAGDRAAHTKLDL